MFSFRHFGLIDITRIFVLLALAFVLLFAGFSAIICH